MSCSNLTSVALFSTSQSPSGMIRTVIATEFVANARPKRVFELMFKAGSEFRAKMDAKQVGF